MAFEIERKYLISFPADPDSFTEKKIDIVQTYLTRPEPSVQRRVRSMSVNGETHYFYTEKSFVTAVTRVENETEIDEVRYNALLAEADTELTPIIKTRRVFGYEGLTFEMDSYPFSEKFATIEAELENEKTVVHLPPFLDIIKEVTGDKSYSNASLALSGCFPEEA